MTWRIQPFLWLGLVVSFLGGCVTTRHESATEGSDLPYPPAEKPKFGEIRHVPTGLQMTFDGAMDVISGARLICIGETHDNLDAHRVELQILRELERRFPGKIALGMEMFRQPQQEALDRWTKGELDELEFLKASHWYDNWGMAFGYYRDILAFARDHHIDVIALEPSRELQDEVRRNGLERLSPAWRAQLPEMGPPDPYQRAAMKAVYGAHLRSDAAFEPFFRVQLLWEESMAARIVDYLGSPRGVGKKMVTLTGGWHVRYGFGIPKKVLRRMPMAYEIVEPDEIEIPEDKKDRLMEVNLPPLPLLPSDFVWYVPYEDLETNRARLGATLAETDGRVAVVFVEKGSPADQSGIQRGDQILTVDSHGVADKTDLLYRLESKHVGETASLLIRRESVERSVQVSFSRWKPAGKPRR